MCLENCLAQIKDTSQWDVRFYILAEGSGGQRWPRTFSASCREMLHNWWNPKQRYIEIPENGDLIHGLMFVNLVDFTMLLVDEADLAGYDFEMLMRALGED